MESHAAIRKRLQAGQYIRRLKEIAVKADSAEASQIPALRLKADIYCKLLSKCLPDLKAVEMTGEGGGPLAVTVLQFGQGNPSK